MDNRKIWIDGIMGVVLGDALGLPVQFLSREELDASPVTDMREYGVFNLPKGSWSDDSSLTLATLESLCRNNFASCEDIMENFADWLLEGQFTPYGTAFDQGNTCVTAIVNYIKNNDVDKCGVTGEYANGNGALMRIMPMCIYGYLHEKWNSKTKDTVLEMIHTVSGLTHNHLRSKIACGIYYFMVKAILDERIGDTDLVGKDVEIDCVDVREDVREDARKDAGEDARECRAENRRENRDLISLLQAGMDEARSFYMKDASNLTQLAYYGRMADLEEFKAVPREEIRSTGYVVDSLEAAVWSLITTDNLEEALLKAVNLGKDTDTVAAIAGGLGALYYGYESVRADWIDSIVKKEAIIELCEKMADRW